MNWARVLETGVLVFVLLAGIKIGQSLVKPTGV